MNLTRYERMGKVKKKIEIIDGPNIFLRPIELTDASFILKSTQNEMVRYLTGTKAVFTLDQIEAFIQKVHTDETRYDFVIVRKSDERCIGDMAIMDIDVETNCAGFRIAMADMEYTKQGLGTQALQALITFVFEELKLNRLQLEVYSHNPHAQHVYEKVGFVHEGILRETLLFEGVYSDEHIMAMLKSDYEAKYKK